ncbi:MAG: hypothetical protein ABI600_16225 [Luteolibacter sp.]
MNHAIRAQLMDCFDPHAQALLVVTQPPGTLSVIPATSATWRLKQPISTGNILRYLLIKVGCDSISDTQISGRHTTLQYTFNPQFPWAAFSDGNCAVSR